MQTAIRNGLYHYLQTVKFIIELNYYCDMWCNLSLLYCIYTRVINFHCYYYYYYYHLFEGDCGGIFWNCRGFIKGAFAVILEVVFAFEAQLWAVICAIENAMKFFWDSLWFDSDSMYVIHFMSSKSLNVSVEASCKMVSLYLLYF